MAILNNRTIELQNYFILKFIYRNISNQNKWEINNFNWLLKKEEGDILFVTRESISSYWGMYW